MRTFLHSLDAGDIVVSLASVQALGGGRYYLTNQKPALAGLLGPLLAKQEYIEHFGKHGKQAITHDFSTFRKGGIPWGVPLGELHARWVRAKVDFSKPWLKANPAVRSLGKIIVSKTARYTNQFFPWKALVKELGHKMIFVGLDQEWRTFCSMNCRYVEFARTSNLLEVAELIAGSDLFIGNQSSPNAVAEGLKHPMVQEVCLSVPDCIYPRDNAVHCADGDMEFELQGKLYSFERQRPKVRLPRQESPPGGWKVELSGRIESHFCLTALLSQVRQKYGSDCPTNLEEMVQAYTTQALKLDAIPESVVAQIAAVKKLTQTTSEFVPS